MPERRSRRSASARAAFRRPGSARRLHEVPLRRGRQPALALVAQCHPDSRACWPGHLRGYEDADGPLDCAAVIDELAPEPDDLVVDKYGYGAFHGTDLRRCVLRAKGVGSLVVTGTVTQICVEESAREAFHHGYRTTVVADAVSSYAPDLHAATLKNFALKFGWVADSGHGPRLAVITETDRDEIERLLDGARGRARALRDARPERRLARQDRDDRPLLGRSSRAASRSSATSTAGITSAGSRPARASART